MGAKSMAKKALAKSATKKPPTKVMKKKGAPKTAAAKRLPRVSRRAEAEPSDDPTQLDAAAPHEPDEPRELSHERLRNTPEETATPAPDEDLVDDVAASANRLDGGAAEADDGDN